jgi:hypothetical protein
VGRRASPNAEDPLKVLIPTPRGRRISTRFLHGVLGAVLFGLSTAVVPATEDAYLDLLDQEVTKVEPVSTDTPENGAASFSPGEGEPAAKRAPSRAHFEALLQRQHVGTHSFYRRLPERIREEVFLDYSSGASMEALREKIIDRYLHP